MIDYTGPVAVIMSTYAADDPHFLRRSINSLLTQSISSSIKINIYLGVDGPVSEEIKNVLKSFDSQLFKLVFFENNRGLAYVLNDLIGLLETEQLVFRMDSDDVSHPTRLRKQIDFMQQNSSVDILGTAIVEICEDGLSRIVSFPEDHESAKSSMFWRTPVAHPTVCVRKRVFEKLGGYPTDSLNEDIALWFRAAKAGFRFSNLSEPLLSFTIGPDFWQRRGLLKAWGEFKCYVKGIYLNDGLSWKIAIPLVRLLFRLGPNSLKKFGYSFRAS
ncbi:glycosyltransferase [Sphingorhabdus sp.]|uniref:glycosyltransferase n=1 Tax=Sphingorhabdus sp. TaxID=1902408 RepID=UPI00359367EA